MKHKKLHQFCKSEKESAASRAELTNDPKVLNDSIQAVNAWDELQGQLHKPKQITKEQFRKSKETALKIISLIADPQYKEEMTLKIENL